MFIYLERVLTVYIYYRLLLHEPLDAWSDPAPQGGPGALLYLIIKPYHTLLTPGFYWSTLWATCSN